MFGLDIENPTGVVIINSLIGLLLLFVEAPVPSCDRCSSFVVVRCGSYRSCGWVVCP